MAKQPKQSALNMGLSNFLDYATLAFKAVDKRYQDLEIPNVDIKQPKPKLRFPYTKYEEPDNPFGGID